MNFVQKISPTIPN